VNDTITASVVGGSYSDTVVISVTPRINQIPAGNIIVISEKPAKSRFFFFMIGLPDAYI